MDDLFERYDALRAKAAAEITRINAMIEDVDAAGPVLPPGLHEQERVRIVGMLERLEAILVEQEREKERVGRALRRRR
jgi:hypothetical protein